MSRPRGRSTPATRRSSSPIEPPFAFVDLDALRRQRATRCWPRRPASRSASPRSRCAAAECCARILELDPGFRGHPRLHAARGAVARRPGLRRHRRRLPDRRSRRRSRSSSSWPRPTPGRAPVPMVDAPPHLDLIEAAIRGGAGPGPRLPRPRRRLVAAAAGRLARIGPKRSPVRTPRRARAMARGDRASGRAPGWPALMAYEGQIAGVGDRIPGRPLRKRGDPPDAGALRARDPPAPAADRRRGPRGGARSSSSTAAEPAAWRARPPRACRHRAHRRLGLLRPGAVRQLPLARPDARPRSSCCRSSAGPRPASSPRSAAAISPRARPGADRLPAALSARGPSPRHAARAPARCRRRCSATVGGAPAGRRPRLHAPRQGRRALRALRLALPGRGRPDRRRGADLPRRGQGVPLALEDGLRPSRPGPGRGPCRRCGSAPSGSSRRADPWKSSPARDRAAPASPPVWKWRLPQCGRPP